MTTERQRSIAEVVLGAGRTGTSALTQYCSVSHRHARLRGHDGFEAIQLSEQYWALTRGVQALAVDLGDRLRPAGGKNPTGFFEDQDLLALNQRLKRVLGVRGHSLRLIDESEWRAPAVMSLHRQALATIQRRFGRAPLWAPAPCAFCRSGSVCLPSLT